MTTTTTVTTTVPTTTTLTTTAPTTTITTTANATTTTITATSTVTLTTTPTTTTTEPTTTLTTTVAPTTSVEPTVTLTTTVMPTSTVITTVPGPTSTLTTTAPTFTVVGSTTTVTTFTTSVASTQTITVTPTSIVTVSAAPTTVAPTTIAPTPAPCYVTGTHIRVRLGLTIQDMAVERLAVGDVVITAGGEPRPIRWIGTRSYPSLTAPKHDRPVHIRAGALADGVPARDLRVSPDHCLWLDGLFVAAGHLVNGTSITRGEAVIDLTYWHIELDSHAMLLAESTPAESFLAAPGVRKQFDGSHRSEVAEGAVPYAPRLKPGPELTALRERLILRAGLAVSVAPRLGAMRAWLDVCDGRRVAGWAQDQARPQVPVCLDVVVNGEVVAMTLAEQYRADLAAAGVGDGRHGFDLTLEEPLAPSMAHIVEVRRSADSVRICAMRADAAGKWTPLLAA